MTHGESTRLVMSRGYRLSRNPIYPEKLLVMLGFRKPVLYPLSYEGIVPICRYFVFLRLGKNTTSC